MTIHDPKAFTDHLAQQISALAEHLATAPQPQAAQTLAQVLERDGLLDAVTGLISVGSRFAQDRATAGVLPAEVWLALGRATNELDDIGVDLDEHGETLRRLSQAPAATRVPPVASPLVARKHR
ncbi:hypothetical protein [Streptomyces erythrochromogenes]|uniref:hypothetical protein n=1 Tax=Streptomyces erythrochromogenes TaxID=285574 RepID=UPI0038653961|nr:hypothetical protein OG364_06280 [Streptomyces erythrochromogenes]